MPGSPGMSPGMPGAGFGAPQEPPAACQQLLTYRDETAKHGQALHNAGQKKLQGGAGILPENPDDGLYPEMKVVGDLPHILFPKLVHHGLKH